MHKIQNLHKNRCAGSALTDREREPKSQSQLTETFLHPLSLSQTKTLVTLSLCLQVLGLGGARCHGDPHLTNHLVWSCLVKGRKGGGGEERVREGNEDDRGRREGEERSGIISV